jgi:two-component system NtrC family sensor kinase
MAEEKILIIDDSPELRSLLESILPFGGYQAVSAGTGAHGLTLVSQEKPDAILVDLELPDMTGLKILEELNRLEYTIPTIMMTGYGSEGVAARALRLGVQGYLIKPFTTEEVLSAIDRALCLGRLRREREQLALLVGDYLRHFRTLSVLGQSVVAGLDLDQFLQRIVEAGLFMTRAEEAVLFVRDEAPDQLQVVAARGPADHSAGCFSAFAGDERLRPALEGGTVVRLHAPPGATIELQSGDTASAVLQAPLKARDRVLGLLSVARRTKTTPFGLHDEQILTILADYAIMAFERNGQAEEAALTA